MLYPLVKPLLFAVDPELAHDVSLELLQQFHRLVPNRRIDKPVEVMGLNFPNPVGLAAGLDKNGDYLDGLARLGFGFIELGSVTPVAQPGNPKPRIFRLTQHRSLINRMGFNNEGVDYLCARVPEKRDYVLGINIGKNKDTPLERAVDDYRICFEKVYPLADYITINISSPNTPGLRELQNEDELSALLEGIRQTRSTLEDRHGYRKPLALKLSPDLDKKAIPVIAELLRRYQVDCLIATNTTLDRTPVEGHRFAAEAGGLSGIAVREHSRDVLSGFYRELGEDIPIISVGGIDSAEEARHRFDAGARLVQLYTGLIYRGPGLVNRIVRSL